MWFIAGHLPGAMHLVQARQIVRLREVVILVDQLALCLLHVLCMHCVIRIIKSLTHQSQQIAHVSATCHDQLVQQRGIIKNRSHVDASGDDVT